MQEFHPCLIYVSVAHKKHFIVSICLSLSHSRLLFFFLVVFQSNLDSILDPFVWSCFGLFVLSIVMCIGVLVVIIMLKYLSNIPHCFLWVICFLLIILCPFYTPNLFLCVSVCSSLSVPFFVFVHKSDVSAIKLTADDDLLSDPSFKGDQHFENRTDITI